MDFSFLFLFPCPEDIGDIVDLIKPIIPYLHMGYQEEDLVEYLDSRIEIDTISSLTLLIELFKVKASLINMHFRLAKEKTNNDESGER